ncbi:MAG: hypothetical protein CVV28_04080 [Methanobacteriales archaeon HGW-Methanobacteriales-1]|jgi:hypothetical protein|nr:MAG: hypothetical protein CVV28_04080 [Methanobacteriales archaeon HGW-Methanobacteriales-1]
MSQDYEENAGGMSYRTLKGVDKSQIMGYLKGHDGTGSAEIHEKNVEYYLASIEKTISRLELARVRSEYANLPDEDFQTIDDKLNEGSKWLNDLKKNLKKTKDTSECLDKISYKKWHAVKLIPSSVEGYVITKSIQIKINRIKGNLSASGHRMHLRNAEKHNESSKKIFLELMQLNETSDLDNAEILRIKAFNDASTAQDILKTKFNQYPR